MQIEHIAEALIHSTAFQLAVMQGQVDELLRLVTDAMNAVAALERERCAQVADAPFGPFVGDHDDYWQPRIAAAIRALD